MKNSVSIKNLIDESEKNKAMFEQLMQHEEQIEDKDGAVYIVAADEIFRPCFDATDKARSQLPTKWFLSNFGTLLSVRNKKLRWLKPDYKDKYGRAYYHVPTSRISNQREKNLSQAALMNIVWGGERYGKAQELLDENGIFAFNRWYKADALNAHHVKGTSDDSPENTQILTGPAHRAINWVPKRNATLEKVAKWATGSLMPVAASEEPGRITIVLTGEYQDKEGVWHTNGEQMIGAVDSVKITKEALNELLGMRVEKLVIKPPKKRKTIGSDAVTE